MHLISQFTIIKENNEFFIVLNIESLSIKSKKSTSNLNIVKIFCDIKKDNAKSKKKKKIQSMVNHSCYLRIVNKESRMNYIKFEISKMFTSHNQIINSWRMIIDENTIWFVNNFITSNQRNVRALKIVRKHKKWKIKAHLQYKQNCANYYAQRVTWEYDILLQIIKENYEIFFLIFVFIYRVYHHHDQIDIVEK